MSLGGMYFQVTSDHSRAHTHIAEAGNEIAFEQKDRRMFWRGAAWTSPDRRILMEVTQNHTDVADIMDITWGKGNDPAPGTFVSGVEMCAWKYIIYTEGTYLIYLSNVRNQL
jgi:hypothetical protein